jgi:hypothetical protein
MKPNYKIIFDNLKDGDCLAFYRKAWYLQLIPFFTREKKGEEAPQHVAECFEVQRTASMICFKLSEQNFHGGQYKDIEIYTINGKYFCENDYFRKQDKIALGSLKVALTDKQKEIGIKDAKSQIGKVYGYNRLIFGSELIEKILPLNFKRRFFFWINKKENQRVCSTHIQYNLYKMGFPVSMKDVYSPLEIIKLPFYNVIV